LTGICLGILAVTAGAVASSSERESRRPSKRVHAAQAVPSSASPVWPWQSWQVGLYKALFTLWMPIPSPRGLQRAPPAFGIDFRAAVAEDFGRVLHRLAILIIEI
jgi:hypothetical protein